MDWTGNYKSMYTTLGASNHALGERQVDDYYATEPKATQLLLDVETFNNKILEPACGEGHMAEILKSRGYDVTAVDKVDRGYGMVGDFFNCEYFIGDIVTNPPYKYAKEFVEHSLKIIPEGNKVAMFLKLTFLEGQARRKMFVTYPPKIVYVASGRLSCAKNGEFEKYPSSAAAYAWFVWQKGFKGNPIIKWIN